MSENINFGGSPDYSVSVLRVLTKIRQNLVGGMIASSIDGTGKDLVIVPYDAGKAANSGDCNALTQADDPKASAPEGVSRRGPAYWYLGSKDNPNTRSDERYDMVPLKAVGTGEGSDVKIYFTPGGSGQTNCGGGAYGSQPDESLHHEMVHALRKMQGKSNPIPTEDSLRRYNTEEEFLAIVVTNMYISAKTKTNTGLRADHWGYTPLRAPLNTSSGFLSDRII